MRVHSMASLVLGLFLLSATCLMGQSWKLPQQADVKENGLRTYRFTEDYTTSDLQGRILIMHRVQGDYTRGLPGNKAIWNNVTVAQSSQAGGPLGPAQQREFMNGFQYDRKASNSLAPDFFKGFPDGTVMERNLVWDTAMFEYFGQDHLKSFSLNEPYHAVKDQDVIMPNIGTFHNRDIQLIWVGRSQRNGQECALILYNAFFNPLEVSTGGMTLKGRSHYWGQIWVSLKTRQIEYGTLYEDVLGEMALPGNNSTQPINTFRYGVFEPLAKK